MTSPADVTMIMVNCNTLPLIKVALESFLSFYTIPSIVVDNGSTDGSPDYIQSLPVQGVYLDTNITHGPALHLAMTMLHTPYAFTLDSDTVTRRGGFIEPMVEIFNDDPNLFALGSYFLADFGGTRSGPYPMVHPSAMMIRSTLYFQGRPFANSGQPVHLAMADARERGNRISGFPINDYIDHLGGGTRHTLLSHRASATVSRGT